MKVCMPELESSVLMQEYQRADCILEYGSGGSTVLASRMGKKVFSVESDKAWVHRMEAETTAKIHHVDIGPTKAFGHPKDKTRQNKWPSYPISVWERDDFVHPDVILVDGRFRVACFLVSSIKIKRPVVVLFDDFDRAQYRVVLDFFTVESVHGRLARFLLNPGKFDFSRFSTLAESFFWTI